jgi:hypothetical protein
VDERAKLNVDAVKGRGRLLTPQSPRGVLGEQVGVGHGPYGAVRLGVDHGDEIQAQPREVHEVVMAQRLATEVRVNQP